MLTGDRMPGMATMLLQGVGSVLLAIVVGPRLARISDSVWWAWLPWVLLALGWTAVFLRMRRGARNASSSRKDA